MCFHNFKKNVYVFYKFLSIMFFKFKLIIQSVCERERKIEMIFISYIWHSCFSVFSHLAFKIIIFLSKFIKMENKYFIGYSLLNKYFILLKVYVLCMFLSSPLFKKKKKSPLNKRIWDISPFISINKLLVICNKSVLPKNKL